MILLLIFVISNFMSITKTGKGYHVYETISSKTSSFLLEINSVLFCLSQEIQSTSVDNGVTTSVNWTGSITNNTIRFDLGYQHTLLPGGMYMGCPSDVAKSVEEYKSFHLELCWVESPTKRQRLVRTYDVEGLAVSSTYFLETKQ